MGGNTELLQWGLKSSLSKVQIKELIHAYSCFICATNKDYYYNGTYLESYIDNLVELQKVIKEKENVLLYVIAPLFEYRHGIDLSNIRITINDTIEFFKYKFAIKENLVIEKIAQKSIEIEYAYLDTFYVQFKDFKLDSKTLKEEILEATKNFLMFKTIANKEETEGDI
jgi:hypothetical protein